MNLIKIKLICVKHVLGTIRMLVKPVHIENGTGIINGWLENDKNMWEGIGLYELPISVERDVCKNGKGEV